MKTPFLGASYRARSVNAAADVCLNLYPEAIPHGGKDTGALYRCPGLELLVTVGNGPVRGLWQLKNYVYAVSSSELYKIDSGWNATLIGSVSGSGPVSIADNGTQIFIACNPDGFIYNTLTENFAQITDPDYPGAVTVSYIDGYFVFNEPDSQRWWKTELLDGLSIDPTEFASAEGSPDGLVALLANHLEVWLWGTQSTEVWYDAGNADFPFARIQGAFIESGAVAAFSIAKMNNTVYWLAGDPRGQGIVYQAAGYVPQRISTHAVEYDIGQIAAVYGISDAIAYTYQEEGHYFYVLTFPAGNRTWVFDVATGLWHQRAYRTPDTNQLIRHRSNCHAYFNNTHVVGDFENGNLYRMSLDVYDDNGDPQPWVRAWRALPTGGNDLNRTFHHSLQLDCESGVGLNGSSDVTDPAYVQGADPQVSLEWSDDGGHTWSNEHWRSMGKIGEFGRRVYWRRLGSTEKLRDRVYRVSGTDPVPITLIGAELLLSAGAS